MSTVANEIRGPDRWPEVWKLFDVDEQETACRCLVSAIADDDQDAAVQRLLHRVASATASRATTIEKQAREHPEKLAGTLRTRATALFDQGVWRLLFCRYYFAHKAALMCAFLDQLGIEHDVRGGINGSFEAPTSDAIAAAVTQVSKVFTVREMARYLTILVISDAKWASAANERDRLLTEWGHGGRRPASDALGVGESVAAASMEFTILDRVVIEHIVRTALGVEGCLDAPQLEELIETLSKLNERWHRAYFHLGLTDVLIPGRTLRFEHAGDNSPRRGWYLAGVVAGFVRSSDSASLTRTIIERADDFTHTAGAPGGAGAAIARNAFRSLVTLGRLNEAIALLRGQLAHLGLDLAWEAEQAATALLRQSQYASAKTILDPLAAHEFQNEEDEDLEGFRLAVTRRIGQCLQAQGDFVGADRAYRSILSSGEERNSPDLLSDLGLARARLKSVTELGLPDGRQEQQAMREALARGEEHFRRAAERFGGTAPKAAYALAVLAFLRWTLSTIDGERERLREAAAEKAAAAVAAIEGSEFGAFYREFGGLAQCWFMLAVARMNGYDEVDGREAMAAWHAITPEAGRFPRKELRSLLDAAEMHAPAFADGIAESIWDYRKDDALDVLVGGEWMTRSPRLRSGLVTLAQREQTPRHERIGLWCSLVPSLIRVNDHRLAREGLSELEQLVDDRESWERLLGFLSSRKNYDPVWTAHEAAWARVFLLRKLGRDVELVAALRELFFAVRDRQPWEAEQILQTFDDWDLDPATASELQARMPAQEIEEAERSALDRLREGESVRIVFVGGNEVQEQYDASVVERVRAEWPGVDVRFEHTGWSSNWGRDENRLVGVCNAADAVVLMYMMRTMLGRTLREALKRPWVPCTSTGRGGMLASVRRAAVVGLEQRLKRKQETGALV